jgi:putative membrane protein
LDWISWRRNGFRVTEQALLVRHGALERSLVLVPHARTQSLQVSQGPWERRLGLADFALHSTPGPITPVVAHLAVEVAHELLATQADRARIARARSGPERWMQR